MNFAPFVPLFKVFEAILDAGRPPFNALFDGFGNFRASYEALDFQNRIAEATESVIQLARLSTMMFCAAAIRNVAVELWEGRHEKDETDTSDPDRSFYGTFSFNVAPTNQAVSALAVRRGYTGNQGYEGRLRGHAGARPCRQST